MSERTRRFRARLKEDPVKWNEFKEKRRVYQRLKYQEMKKDPSIRIARNYRQRTYRYKKKIKNAIEMSDAENTKTKSTSSRSFDEVMIKEDPMKLDEFMEGEQISDPAAHQEIKKGPSRKKRNDQQKLYRPMKENKNTIEESEILDSYIGNYKTKSLFLRACQKVMDVLPKDRESKTHVLKFLFYKFNLEC
ncbi:CLUMA_CG017536, isoform A [Clunio marinus]|uniref:CLUMA_CG017536, isoform A n=1 Tax=Clunio marinus TaxID=568069 RepID=A0A1J1IY11_9DIPT|nr:CLUMA_CG017536, isoform A [Clunio marinus]